jgi:hypothetical protein
MRGTAMKRATAAMGTTEHERWMRRTVDRVIGTVLVVGISAGLLVAWNAHQGSAERDARRAGDCIMAGRPSNC